MVTSGDLEDIENMLITLEMNIDNGRDWMTVK